MVTTITAVYENGVLRPLKPLLLKEQQEVQLQILEVSTTDEAAQAVQVLVSLGALTPPFGDSEVASVTGQERRLLSLQLGKGLTKPVSDYILEERGDL